MTGGSPDRFRYHFPPAQADRLRDFAVRETRAGRRAEVQAALRELDYRLTYEAGEWGEGRDYLPDLRVRMRFATAGPISVWYGVEEANRLVQVREVRFRGDPQEG